MSGRAKFIPDTVIYHGGCYDGFTSAWLCWKSFGNIEFLPAKYGAPLPEPKGDKVLMVDFSYPRGHLVDLNSRLDSFLVLDHHKTAEAALKGLEFCLFDMERAGCQMTWDWLGECNYLKDPEWMVARPWLVDHVADRDLWRLDLEDTPAIHAYYTSVPMNFEAWDEMASADKSKVVEYGTAIRGSIDRYCEKVGKDAIDMETRWGPVQVVNAPYLNASELASHLMNTGPYDWSVAWFQRRDGRFQYSLRGRGVDVSVIATECGGGGHSGAAGFDSPDPPWKALV